MCLTLYCTQMLIDAGADLEQKDAQNLTALQVSLLSGGLAVAHRSIFHLGRVEVHLFLVCTSICAVAKCGL